MRERSLSSVETERATIPQEQMKMREKKTGKDIHGAERYKQYIRTHEDGQQTSLGL